MSASALAGGRSGALLFSAFVTFVDSTYGAVSVPRGRSAEQSAAERRSWGALCAGDALVCLLGRRQGGHEP